MHETRLSEFSMSSNPPRANPALTNAAAAHAPPAAPAAPRSDALRFPPSGSPTSTPHEQHEESVYDAVHAPRLYVGVVKPAIDRIVALVLLVLLLPVLLASMLAVRISLGPGVFFLQERIGLRGRRFTTYKLRTMQTDRRASSDEIAAIRAGRWDGVERRVTHKSAEDPRLTGVGELLRKLSLDEIPQLFNILRGDMSLVGPRPELPMIVDRHYEPWQHRRHAVKPGLTGLWQVSERGNGMMHEHIDVDLDYVDRIGFWTDLKILLATPYAALGPRKGF